MTVVRAIEEAPWWLDVNGERAASGTVLPDALDQFFVGRLAGDGVVAARGDLLSLEVTRRADGIIAARALVTLARARAASEERRHRAQHGCGPLYLATCSPPRMVRARAALPPLDVLRDLFRALFASADVRHKGGVHTAALSDGGQLSHQFEDVGRHNAVDKAIGGGLMEEVEMAQRGLVVSARISGDIAGKAARAGLAWIASRSVPTTLAVRVAEANGLPLIARAAGRDAAIFAGGP
jgi:FdhD protein